MVEGIREHERVTLATAREVRDAMVKMWPFGFAPTPPRVRVPLAHSALETGKWSLMRNNSLGNAKARKGDGRRHVFFYCNEVQPRAVGLKHIAEGNGTARLERDLGYDAKGNDQGLVVGYYPDHEECRFRAYETLEQGVGEHLRMLMNQRNFKPAIAAIEAADPAQFCSLLKRGSYFTAPLGPYMNTVVRLFEEFASLDINVAVETSRDVQRALVTLGYGPLTIDGDVGPRTKVAVVRFQRDHGLMVDGVVGPQTKRALSLALVAKR